MRILALEHHLKKRFCLLTKSGSSAMYVLIKSLEIRDKRIIVPANICFDIILTIIYSGNIPLVIDIDQNQCLSLRSLLKIKKTKNIGAIIYPYMYGNYGNILPIKKFADNNSIYLIEDLAPSLGIRVPVQKRHKISDYSICSFGTGKIIDLGFGGSINTNSEKLYLKAKKNYSALRTYSKKLEKKYLELNEISSKIEMKQINKTEFSKLKLKKYKDCLISKYNFKESFLKKLSKSVLKINLNINNRARKAKLFRKYLKNKNIKLIKHKKGAVYWRQNAIVFKNRDKLLNHLVSNGVYARKYFPSLSELFPFIKKDNLINANNYGNKIINFWVGQKTSKQEILRINKLIKNFYK